MKACTPPQTKEGIFHKDAQQAFEEAIAKGNLSTVPEWENYAGNYMYMYSEEIGRMSNRDWFKHIETRHYMAVTHTPTDEA